MVGSPAYKPRATHFIAARWPGKIVDFHQSEGGLLTADDMDEFSVEVESSAHVGFRDWEVHGCGPWCQGPMLLQALKLIEGFDIASLGHNSAEYLHIVVEGLKARCRRSGAVFR